MASDPDREQDNPSTMDRRALLRRSAVVGGTLWVVPMIQSVAAPAFGAVQSPVVPPEVCGRMTGGGNNPGLGPITRYGFELHCSTTVGPNNLEVSFIFGGQEVNFHLDTLTSVNCVDDPTVVPDPPDADFDTLIATGTGHFTGPGAPGCTADDSATIQFRLVDGGEGPGNMDFAEFHIQCNGVPVLDVAGRPFGGNIQAHDATGVKQCP